MSNAANTPDLRKITNLEAHLRTINYAIEAKCAELADARRRRIARLPLRVPICRLLEQLQELQEQFDFAIAEFDFRRI